MTDETHEDARLPVAQVLVDVGQYHVGPARSMEPSDQVVHLAKQIVNREMRPVRICTGVLSTFMTLGGIGLFVWLGLTISGSTE